VTSSRSKTASARAAAYTRTDLVQRRGAFPVRGGILDVFPPTEQHPLRVEFWWHCVEEIRHVKVADQRSLEMAEHGLWLRRAVSCCSPNGTRACPDTRRSAARGARSSR
jgi:transcription-repair coupling factor (superfamily II helicase)